MNALLAGKNVLVTGAGRNIGRSIAIEMAREGANVVLTEIDDERRRAVDRELAQFPGVSRSFLSDVSDPAASDELVASLKRESVHIDVLVNNVGIHPSGVASGEARGAVWEAIFRTNVLGPAHLTRSVAQSMIARKCEGTILFVSSIHQSLVRRLPPYSASKAAIGMLVKEWAVAFAPYGIRVNGIAPGAVGEDKRGQPRQHKYTPLRRTSIPPRYIGRAAVFLASDYFSGYTTGATLTVDAGLSLFNHAVHQSPP